MSDRYASFVHSGPGRAIVRRLGLPDPPRLRRYTPGDPVVSGSVLLGGSGRLANPVAALLKTLDADLDLRIFGESDGPQTPSTGSFPENAGKKNAALIFDATSIVDTAGLRGLYDFFHPSARSLSPSGRVIVFGGPPESTAQQALEGFVRSVGKEFGRGSTAQLVRVEPGAEAGIESTLRFLLSARSAYVSGQVVAIGIAPVTPPADWTEPLAGTVALVTGAARGIGKAIATVLARDGAHVVCLDVPAAGDSLSTVANNVGGTAYQLDLTSAGAPERLASYVDERHGRLDIVVHNAGITRDKTIARMTPDQWDSVLDVNLSSQERINTVLLDRGLIPDGGRIAAVSSVSGIAGNRGQTNYATSKAGVIGLVRSLAPAMRDRAITVNAVAPGFIETKMTAAMPVLVREAGRRMNSMAQGGLPVDVAETIAWFASPGSAGVTGNVIRVCGQSLLGA